MAHDSVRAGYGSEGWEFESLREAVNHDNIEGRGLRRVGFNHTPQLWPAVVSGGSAGLDKRLDQLATARGAIGFARALLVRD